MLLICEKSQFRSIMKIANHQLYYGVGLSWDYIERLVCKTGGNSKCRTKRTGHRPLQRYHKNCTWNKRVRRSIKNGVFDGINLTQIKQNNFEYA